MQMKVIKKLYAHFKRREQFQKNKSTWAKGF